VLFNCFILLDHYAVLDDITLDAVLAMFERITVKHQLVALFYKLSFLNTFHKILQDKHFLNRHPRFADFIQQVVSTFFETLKVYPLLYIQVLFPKMRRDAADIGHAMKGEAMEKRPKTKEQKQQATAEALNILQHMDDDDAMLRMLDEDELPMPSDTSDI
jgi:hypothetical protein